jgi:RNA polymerase sigma-70 factor (ECF subfamily)
MKPWLLAILRNVCRDEFARRSRFSAVQADTLNEAEPENEGLWAEAPRSPETEALQRLDGETIRRLITELPTAFRETLVLREINDLSYREIADATGVPVGTVMSRLARAREMLRTAWQAEEASA